MQADKLDVMIMPGRTAATSIDREGPTVYVRAFSAEAWELLVRAEGGDAGSEDALLSRVPELYVHALRTALGDVATYCELPEPPPLPATNLP